MFDLRAVVCFFSCTVVSRGGLHGQFEFTGRINKNFFNVQTLNSKLIKQNCQTKRAETYHGNTNK